MVENKWISVNDRLPVLNTDVLVCEGEDVFSAYFWNYCGVETFHSSHDQEAYPSHWMPLPEPPKSNQR